MINANTVWPTGDENMYFPVAIRQQRRSLICKPCVFL